MEPTSESAFDQALQLFSLAINLHGQRHLTEAEKVYRQVLTLFKSLEGVQDAQASCIMNLANCVKQQGRLIESEDLYRHALYETLEGTQADQARCLMELGNYFANQNELVEAENLYRQALALLQPLEGAHTTAAICMVDLVICLAAADPLSQIEEQDALLSNAREILTQLDSSSEINTAKTLHSLVLAQRACSTEQPQIQQALLEEALELAVPVALDADTRRYQFPSESRRRMWMETTAAARVGLALRLAAETGNAELISDLIAVWRTAGTLNHDSEAQAAAAPSSSHTPNKALDILLAEAATTGNPTSWAPPLAAGGNPEPIHEYNLKRKPTPTLLMPNRWRKAAESFTATGPLAAVSKATAYYR